MAISPMLCGSRSGFGKLALVSGFALILVMFALPAFALTGDLPATADATVAADPQSGSTPPEAAPKPVGFVHQDTMFNWGPERQKLAERGLTFNFHYITDAFGDVNAPKGTDERFSNWQRIRGTMDIDFGKFSDAKGLLFHVTGVWQNGVNMGAVIGSIANPSGIVSSHQFRVDSITLTQQFMKDKVEVTAGIMAAQDLYGLQYYIGQFLSEPIFYNFGNMGNTRTSYDPESSPAVNLKIIPDKHWFVQTGYFMPSDDGEEHNYPVGLNYKNGHHGGTSDTAVGYYSDPGAPATRKSYPGFYEVGFIYNGSQAGKPLGSPSGVGGFFDYSKGTYVDNNWLIYIQANQPIYRMTAGSNRGVDVAFGVNTGPQAKSEVPTEFTAGLIFRGPIAPRPKDSLNFGFVYSKIGSDFNSFQKLQLLPTLNDEKMFEANYLIQVFPWLVIQPTWQHYASVGGSNSSADLAGFRLLSTF